jgi:hypothetical protein
MKVGTRLGAGDRDRSWPAGRAAGRRPVGPTRAGRVAVGV